jgi:hypothetical protein
MAMKTGQWIKAIMVKIWLPILIVHHETLSGKSILVRVLGRIADPKIRPDYPAVIPALSLSYITVCLVDIILNNMQGSRDNMSIIIIAFPAAPKVTFIII